jgi:ribosome-binding factor A
MSRRTHRISDQLRAELGDLLLRELRDPRVGMASITDVDVTPDLGHARIRVSVLGDEETRTQTLEALGRASGFLRSRLAKRLNLRATPVLVFELDRGAEHSRRISDLLEELDHDHDDT